jgi:hypothetical protein
MPDRPDEHGTWGERPLQPVSGRASRTMDLAAAGPLRPLSATDVFCSSPSPGHGLACRMVRTKAEAMAHPARPQRSATVEFATVEGVDRLHHRRLLEPLGGMPPAEAEARYNAALEDRAVGAVTQANQPPASPGRLKHPQGWHPHGHPTPTFVPVPAAGPSAPSPPRWATRKGRLLQAAPAGRRGCGGGPLPALGPATGDGHEPALRRREATRETGA